MFGRMTEVLPAYEEFLIAAQSWASGGTGQVAVRLSDAMKFLYTDIVQFCHRVYRLFSAEKYG